MEARLVAFGVLEIDGTRYEHDVVIEHGSVRKRKKGPSRPYRDEYGHTPLSAAEAIPWSAPRLVIGTGAAGQLPVAADVLEEAARHGVEIVTEPTRDACARISRADPGTFAAILHVTC